jgi:hypothetical protein
MPLGSSSDAPVISPGPCLALGISWDSLFHLVSPTPSVPPDLERTTKREVQGRRRSHLARNGRLLRRGAFWQRRFFSPWLTCFRTNARRISGRPVDLPRPDPDFLPRPIVLINSTPVRLGFSLRDSAAFVTPGDMIGFAFLFVFRFVASWHR